MEEADQQEGWQVALPELVFLNNNGVLSTDAYGLARLLLLVKIDACAAPELICARQLAPAAWGRVLWASSRTITPAAPGWPTAA